MRFLDKLFSSSKPQSGSYLDEVVLAKLAGNNELVQEDGAKFADSGLGQSHSYRFTPEAFGLYGIAEALSFVNNTLSFFEKNGKTFISLKIGSIDYSAEIRDGEASYPKSNDKFDYEYGGGSIKVYRYSTTNDNRECYLPVKDYENKDGVRVVRVDTTESCEIHGEPVLEHDSFYSDSEGCEVTVSYMDHPVDVQDIEVTNFFAEYDKDGKHYLHIDDNVIALYTDENGRPAALVNGYEISEYTDEQGHDVLRINNNEIVTYTEDIKDNENLVDVETIIEINGHRFSDSTLF